MSNSILEQVLESIDVQINGSRPWDITVHNQALFERVARQGTLGAGEAYMDGWWDCEELDELACRLLRTDFEASFKNSLPVLKLALRQFLFNLQNTRKASEVAERHYNMDNDLFEAMLGKSMNYSCAYWYNASSLDEAQTAKMDLICKKLQLKKGMKVLDIGCGWGGLDRYMAETYGAAVTGVNISEEQIRYAREHDPDNTITWLLEDYRNVQGQFERVVSVGMFEHVGTKNYNTYMKAVRKLLMPNGFFLLHTIGSNHQKKGTDPWINKYIFPNGMLPSPQSLVRAFGKHFVLEDWHNFGAHYDKTLMAWYKSFEEGLRKGLFRCENRIRRMYRYYLLTCAGAFRARNIHVWQLVLSPSGVPGGYQSVR